MCAVFSCKDATLGIDGRKQVARVGAEARGLQRTISTMTLESPCLCLVERKEPDVECHEENVACVHLYV